jgi:hypothetical protein
VVLLVVFVVGRFSMTGSVAEAEAPNVKGTSVESSTPARCSGVSNGEKVSTTFGFLRGLSDFFRGRRDCFFPSAASADRGAPEDDGAPPGEADPGGWCPSCIGDAGILPGMDGSLPSAFDPEFPCCSGTPE